MDPPNDSNPPLSLFSSLPTDLVLSILARISNSYYPTISLVSKSFRSIILSKDLRKARVHHRNLERCVIVRLQPPTQGLDSISFNLWIKPEDHQTLPYSTGEVNSTGNCLLPVPSSYTTRVPECRFIVGSDTYKIRGQNTSSSSTDVWVYNNHIGKRKKAPSMNLARKNPLMRSFNGKLYVMGGCDAGESMYWAEVFDPRTQTWEPLPDPGADLRLISPLKKIQMGRGKVFVMGKKNFVYLEKENRWEVCEEKLCESTCTINKVGYSYHDNKLWCKYDPKCEEWILVQGLSKLNQYDKIDTEIGNYGGKLIIFWVGPLGFPLVSTSAIWCAVILLKKHHYGQIEWVDHVLTVPGEYTLLPFVSSLH